MLKKGIVLFLIVVGTCSLGWAKQEARQITLKEAVSRALSTHPSIKAARAQGLSAVYAAKSLFMQLFPKITLSATYYRMGPLPTLHFSFLPKNPGNIPPDCAQTLMCLGGLFSNMPKEQTIGKANNFSFSVSFAQPLTTALTIYYLYKSKLASGTAAQLQAKQAQKAIEFAVKSAFYGLLQLIHTLDVLEATLKSLKSHKEQVESFVQAGVANRVDLLRVQVAMSQTKSTLEGLKAQLKAVRSTFNALIGLSRDEVVQLVEPGFSPKVDLKSIDYYRDKALRVNLTLKNLRSTVEALRNAKNAAVTQWLPQGSIFGSYGYTYGNEFMPEWAWQVGVGLQWSWDWWATGYQVDQAKAGLQGAREALKAARISVLNEVDKAYRQVEAAQAKFRYIELQLKEAEEALRLMEDRYRAGVATNTDCLDAQADLLRARAEELSTKYELLTALAYLDYAVWAGGSTAQGGSQGGMDMKNGMSQGGGLGTPTQTGNSQSTPKAPSSKGPSMMMGPGSKQMGR